MLVEKNDLQKTLRILNGFDSSANPYVAVQLPEGGKPVFYRQSANGFIQSKEYDPNAPSTYISLSHLMDILKYVQDEKLQIFTDPRGILRVESTNPLYPAHLAVHTVPREATGIKNHAIGEPRKVVLDPATFAAFDAKPFHSNLSAQPTLRQGKLLIENRNGVTIWDGHECLKPIGLSPREPFLRLVSGVVLEDLVISSHGYWTAVLPSGMVAAIMGHDGNDGMYEKYSVSGEVVATLPSEPLCYALNTASNLSGATRMDIDPKKGAIFKDRYGDASNVSFGDHDFAKFTILSDSAKMVADTLSLAKDTDTVLLKVAIDDGAMRFKRGAFEVNVKLA